MKLRTKNTLLLAVVTALLTLGAMLITYVCQASTYDELESWKSTAHWQEKLHKLPGGFLNALIQQESSWKPHVVSNRGAIGLAQVLPSTVETVEPGRYVGPKVYSVGIKSYAVLRIQNRLKRDSTFNGPASRLFSNKLAWSVRSFQLANGLVGDGTVGPTTWAVLFPGDVGYASPAIVAALHDPQRNIQIAAKYFTWMLNQPQCPKSLAARVAAYYSGCRSQIVKYVTSVERKYGKKL